ncbi:MAG TPA: DmsC/YnfH family molybdoenzyme membrane anchor subunit [Acidimicrobiales bacterium]|nr:DmsC/YnfH family molybdoenzyme membrane anchor subunit [Acidimicrobiales bacterium]
MLADTPSVLVTLTGAMDSSGVTGTEGPELLPLDAGEQYRFGFAMDACIGCHSCEVACAEQNDTPIDVAWRRVGELEGGEFPRTRRFNLSMACNHCLEPTCLSGCPTNAYEKLVNGVVRHDADECIGCQYCIWNCPYEVPVFDRRRKIVSKCDMCLPRLDVGQAPACVGACPTHAITVEKVEVAAWRADHTEADAPGLPPAGITLSTTRVTLPENMPAGTAAASDHRVDPEDPHWPLIGLTLLTQLSLGIVAATVATQLAGSAGRGTLAGGAVGGAVAGATALAASLVHLGRPTHAFKALRNLRTSWLSREVALFSAFAAVSLLYAGAWRAAVRGGVPAVGMALGVAAVLLGVTGVYASGRLYLVPARPVWNSRRTLVSFFATAVSVGPLVTLFCLDRAHLDPAWIGFLLAAAGAGTVVQLAVHAHLVRTVRGGDDRQHRGTATLLRGRFRDLVAFRLGLAGVGLALLVSAFAVPLAGPAAAGRFGVGLVVLGLGELIGRYLFYVTVVPFGTAGNFFERS